MIPSARSKSWPRETIPRAVLRLWKSLARINAKKIGRRFLAFKSTLNNTYLNSLWSDQEFILTHMHLMTEEYLEKNRHVQEIEHQVGRYLSMKKIVQEIIDSRLTGDVVEFGTWQGLGLIYLGSLFSQGSIRRTFWGIDSFEGLPKSSTIWTKGNFDNTSLGLANENLRRRFPKGESQFELIKGWFSEDSVRDQLHTGCKKICLVHFDADLGTSTAEALRIVESYVFTQRSTIYFLFDDWGCHPDEVPDAFYEWFVRIKETHKLQLTKLSSTRFTRYYKLNRN